MNTKSTLAKLVTIGALTASLTLAAAIAPASAAQLGTGTTSYTKSELEDLDYTCEVVSLGFTECTKGDIKYWCSGGTCTKKRTTSGNLRPELFGISKTVFTNAYTPISVTTPRPMLRGNPGVFSIAR